MKPIQAEAEAEAEISSTAAGGAKKPTADRGTQRPSTGYSNHELDAGQNNLILCPNTQKY